MARKKPIPTPSTITFPFRVVVPVASYRKFPDPVHNTLYHHTGYIPALLYPDTGFPNSENIRPANIDRAIYKDIAASLRNQDCIPNLYHLKSKGELHVATAIRELGPEEAERWFEAHLREYLPEEGAFGEFTRKYKLVEVVYEEGCSIVDGGHTDKIWSDPENLAAVRATYTIEKPRPVDGEDAPKPTPRNQNHLAVEWLVGVPSAWLPEVVGGRNTGLQVQDKTLANHEGKFAWLKAILDAKPYGNLVAYRENEDRRVKPIDIREVVALIAPFNRDLFTLQDEPNKKQPLIAFTSKKAMLDTYIDDMDKAEGARTFPKLAPIVADILELSDLIHLDGVKAYNQKTGGRGGRLNFVDHREPGKEHVFAFAGRTGADRLADGALYPLLGAFASRVTTGSDGKFAWNTPGGFAGVKKIWTTVAGGMMEATAEFNKSLAYNPAQVGKSAYHWRNMFREVEVQKV
jgi:hypothetical protein